MLSKSIQFFCSCWLILLLTSCGSSGGGSSSSSSQAPLPYCETVTSYSDSITLTGTAKYEYRTNGNGAVATAKPIRHAEIRVLNSSGTILQCGETSANGTFSLSLPNNGEAATVYITSRSFNNHLKAYVLNNPTNNSFHSISTSVTLNSSKSIGTLKAPATGTLPGGAFNILDKLLDANDFLRDETDGCTTTFAQCTPFTVAPLVTAYWTAGVNPGVYVGGGVVSFYIPTDRELYILGGIDGNVDSSDTDHFDDSIILHEYGHFLEDVYSRTNSPGGAHNGNTILDPRLAWGEGWANYFQAAVTGNPVYRDTFGTPLGLSGVYFNENLESGTDDSASTLGEGNFREFAITRALWDITDTNNEGAGVDETSSSFSEFWTVFTSNTIGFAKSSLNFRNIGLFYEIQGSLSGGSDWSSVQTGELQKDDLSDYSNTLDVGSSCGVVIQAANISGSQPENGTVSNSNQFASNDFYQYTHSGGNLNISLAYTTTGGNPADLDLYLYANDYTFGQSDTVLASSTNSINSGESSDTESISLSSLAAGTYMININVYTKNRLGASANYTLTINSQPACPN